MCEPATLSAVSIGATVLGTGVSIYGQMQQGQAASKMAAYQRGVAENNAILANRAAQDALDRGKAEERRRREATRQLIGRQRAVLAGNGVVVDQGSALDITTDTAGMGELDALTIRSNAEREAAGFRAQGANFTNEAYLATMAGNNARTSMYLGIGGSALFGVGSVASKWYNFTRAGVGTGGGITGYGGIAYFDPLNS